MAKGKLDYNYGDVALRVARNGRASACSIKDDAGEIFHTYSTYGRGVEVMMGTYNMLDLTPKGRDERTWHTQWSGCVTTTATSQRRCEDKPAAGRVAKITPRTAAPQLDAYTNTKIVWPWPAVAGHGPAGEEV